ncbi:MAG TPA: hypothetical protein VJ732_12805 [Bryobacteraceae bacterium]|nr:hypothetical protein [Bryobacteraceae bacterium]
MNDSVFFATFDPVFCDAPATCERCGEGVPVFQYEHCTQNQRKEREYVKGFCCGACADLILQQLKAAESREWAEEETALQADDLDPTELHQRRVAAFAGDQRKRTQRRGRAQTAVRK